MAASGASFEVDFDTRDLDRVLEDMGGDVESKLRGIMSVVAEMLVTGVSDRYDTSGEGSWKATVKGNKPLHGPTGRLANSTNPFFGSDFAEASTGVEYIKYHLEGGPVIPKRNPFELADDVLDEVEDFVLEQIGKAMEG